MKPNTINNVAELLEMAEGKRLDISDYRTAIRIKWIIAADIDSIRSIDYLTESILKTC